MGTINNLEAEILRHDKKLKNQVTFRMYNPLQRLKVKIDSFWYAAGANGETERAQLADSLETTRLASTASKSDFRIWDRA